MKCEICGIEIPEGRMEAVPDTVLCMTHAREAEKYGGEFKLTGVCGNIGKAGSLKKNYGDVEVHKHRNEDALERLRQNWKAKL